MVLNHNILEINIFKEHTSLDYTLKRNEFKTIL